MLLDLICEMGKLSLILRDESLSAQKFCDSRNHPYIEKRVLEWASPVIRCFVLFVSGFFGNIVRGVTHNMSFILTNL